jgi:hypothetical protein
VVGASAAASNKLSLIVPRIVLLAVPKTSTTVWVLILLFGTPTATTTLLTTLAAFVTTLVLTTLAALISLLATLILTLISRHHLFPRWDFPGSSHGTVLTRLCWLRATDAPHSQNATI